MVIRFKPDLTASDVVARSLERVGEQIAYGLGKGGRDPDAFDAVLDCSGHVAKSLGIDRFAPGLIGGDWIWTDGMLADASGPRRMFFPVTGLIEPGDIVVIPGKRSLISGRRIPGHCGVVVEGGATISACRVSHCHGPSGRIPAVGVRDGRPWRRGMAMRFDRARVAAALAKLRARIL